MTSDGIRLHGLLAALGAVMDGARAVVLDAQPVPQMRARSAKGTTRVYKDPQDRDREQVTATLLRKHRFQRHTGNVALAVIAYRRTLGTVDGDNLMKHLMDAAKGILWVDDAQVTAHACIIELDRERPRTCLAIAAHRSTMLRGTAGQAVLL